MKGFIEIIGEYTDGQKLDLFINVSRIQTVRACAVKDDETSISMADDTQIRCLEPYVAVKIKIQEAL